MRIHDVDQSPPSYHMLGQIKIWAILYLTQHSTIQFSKHKSQLHEDAYKNFKVLQLTILLLVAIGVVFLGEEEQQITQIILESYNLKLNITYNKRVGKILVITHSNRIFLQALANASIVLLKVIIPKYLINTSGYLLHHSCKSPPYLQICQSVPFGE